MVEQYAWTALAAARRSRAVVGPVALVMCIVACGACGSDDDSAADQNAGKGGSAGTGSGNAGSGGSSGSSASGSGGSSGSSSEPFVLGEGKSTAELVGNFELSLIAARAAEANSQASAAVSKVLGTFTDAVTPTRTKLVMKDESGDCTLFTPLVPFCASSCAATGAVCTDDDVCTPLPSAQDVGTIRLSAGDSQVDIKLVAKNYQLTADNKLPYPPCAEGEPVKIEVEGGEYKGFAIGTRCIAPLEIEGPFAIESGKPLALAWKAPGDDEIATVHIALDISHHGGGSKGEIQCDVPDSGAFEIPATLVDQLTELGIAGFPTVQLTRVAIGHAETPEPSHVMLSVSMFAERAVTIPGLASCASDDSECPDGQKCQPDLTCK